MRDVSPGTPYPRCLRGKPRAEAVLCTTADYYTAVHGRICCWSWPCVSAHTEVVVALNASHGISSCPELTHHPNARNTRDAHDSSNAHAKPNYAITITESTHFTRAVLT